MPLIDTLEKKLGHFAIPGVVNMLAGAQLAVWVLLKFQPTFLETLVLFPPAVYQGQVWRLITWVFIPTQTSPIWMFFTVLFMFMISNALDEAWGIFRVNLYVLGGVAAVIIGVMLLDVNPGYVTGTPLDNSLFLAFAVFYPNYELLLFLILPFKAKYLAFIMGGMYVLDFIGSPGGRWPLLFSQLNFLVTFGPKLIMGISQRAEANDRKARFQAARKSETPFLHRCHVCGKTELDDPKLEFRVAGDGNDYCNVCLAQKS